MEPNLAEQQFIQFLQTELAIAAKDIALVLRHRRGDHDPLPMLLWQYGLVSLDQLSQIFDWRANQVQLPFSLGQGQQLPLCHPHLPPSHQPLVDAQKKLIPLNS